MTAAQLRAALHILMTLAVTICGTLLIRAIGRNDVLAAQNAALAAQADSLERAYVPLRAENDSLRRRAAASAAPHVAATRDAELAEAAIARSIAAARAASRRDSLTLEEARAEIERIALAAEELVRRHRVERAAASTRILQLQAVVDHSAITFTAADRLIETRRDQVDVLQRRHSWWRRVLQVSCEGTGAAGGATIGAVAGGPGGAAVGAVAGVVGAALVCP